MDCSQYARSAIVHIEKTIGNISRYIINVFIFFMLNIIFIHVVYFVFILARLLLNNR